MSGGTTCWYPGDSAANGTLADETAERPDRRQKNRDAGESPAQAERLRTNPHQGGRDKETDEADHGDPRDDGGPL